MPKKQYGKLIVLDGVDGSGKATQTELLRKRLQKEKIRVKKIDFPRYDDNFFGELLGKYLTGTYGDFVKTDPRVASVLYAADRFESRDQIRKWLEQGYIVLADRYVSANMIHQGGKFTDARKRRAFLSWLDEMEHEVFNIPRPDLVVYLDVPFEVSHAWLKNKVAQRSKTYQKGGRKDVAEDNLEHLKASRNAALSLERVNKNWERVKCCTGMKCMSPDEVHEYVVQIISKRLKII